MAMRIVRVRFALIALLCAGAEMLLAAQATYIRPQNLRRLPEPAAQGVIEWHPGIAATETSRAAIVRVPRGIRAIDLAVLRDDQVIQTPSGAQMRAGTLRAIRAAIATARQHTSVRRAGAFAILPAPTTRGTPPRPGETAAEILARPPTDVILLPSGHSITVAQLRLMAPYVERRYRVDLRRANYRRLQSGPTIKIQSIADLKTLPRDTPDGTVLETPQGTRVTLGALKAALKAQYGSRIRPRPAIGNVQ